MISAASLALQLQAASARRLADPLARYGFASQIHRSVVQFLREGVEVHHRAASKGGKTQNGAAWVGAFLQQRPDLAGERMPVLGRRATGNILVRNYESQKDASQKALRDWIGDWPHRESMLDTGRDLVNTFWVKPIGHMSDDFTTWSRATFISQANSTIDSVRGQRNDFCWFDEPPFIEFLREVRKNARYILTTETPLDEDEWHDIAKDFEGCIGVPREGRVELVSTLEDNRFLPEDEKATLRARYRNDPHFRARMFGEYVDAVGDCPLDVAKLQRLLRWADPGKAAEFDPRVETWRDLDAREEYFVLLDPSAGVRPTLDSEGGDKCAMNVVGVRSRAQVARFYGHLPPAELARMGLEAARYYNTALLVPEVNGLGEAMLPVLEPYRNVYREYALERDDRSLSGRRGWYQTEQTKAAILGSLITAVAEGWFDIACADSIRSLMALKLDDRGKSLVRRKHQNHEDFITLGMAAYLLQHPSYAAAPEKREEDKLPSERFEDQLARDIGRRVRVKPRAAVARAVPDRWR